MYNSFSVLLQVLSASGFHVVSFDYRGKCSNTVVHKYVVCLYFHRALTFLQLPNWENYQSQENHLPKKTDK